MNKEYNSRADINILIMEDEALIAMALKVKIKNEGYTACEIAENGDAAMRNLQAENPDIVLADIILGENDNGIDIAKRMKESIPDLPIIFLTGYEIDDVKDEAMIVNPLGFFIKPVEVEVIARIIDSHFGLT